jgi:pimeloyl-ACP methyl ester carboxylesterase
MDNVRAYGRAPFKVAVIHGGPGAAGEMAPVARELASLTGVLEPLQTADSVAGQIEELKTVLEEKAELPVTLTGYSWGAWLSLLLAANHPHYVRKLILISCGPLDENYVPILNETRLKRLSEEERVEFQAAIKVLNDPASADKNTALERLGALAAMTDTFDPLPDGPHEPVLTDSGNIFYNVWREAEELRRSRRLLECIRQVRCPVVALHGEYDPHPEAGVREPLSAIVKDFRFVLLPNCGHTPWLERQAKEAFYRALKAEVG